MGEKNSSSNQQTSEIRRQVVGISNGWRGPKNADAGTEMRHKSTLHMEMNMPGDLSYGLRVTHTPCFQGDCYKVEKCLASCSIDPFAPFLKWYIQMETVWSEHSFSFKRRLHWKFRGSTRRMLNFCHIPSFLLLARAQTSKLMTGIEISIRPKP